MSEAAMLGFALHRGVKGGGGVFGVYSYLEDVDGQWHKIHPLPPACCGGHSCAADQGVIFAFTDANT